MSVGKRNRGGGKTRTYTLLVEVDRYDLYQGRFSGTCQHKMLTSFDSASLVKNVSSELLI